MSDYIRVTSADTASKTRTKKKMTSDKKAASFYFLSTMATLKKRKVGRSKLPKAEKKTSLHITIHPKYYRLLQKMGSNLSGSIDHCLFCYFGEG